MTGFVGQHLKNHLLKKGYEISSVSKGDLCDPYSVESWRTALEKAECATVIHLIAKTHAADARDPSALSTYRRVNVGITRALLEASKDYGVKRFVYLSSIKAVGEETPIDQSFTEESPCNPEDCYGITKREAEELILKNSRSIETLILRPPLIYGPGVKGNFLKLMNAVQKGIPLPFAKVKNARSMLNVYNLTYTIQIAVESHASIDRIFHIADNEAVSTSELIHIMALALGKTPRLFPCSSIVLEKLGNFLGKSDTIKKLTRSLVVSNERVKKLLSITLPYTLPTGIETTASWLWGLQKQTERKIPEE